ncbi:M15 family metallopeptidase [Cellulomonas cellasea]|uniref:M15 family metallopeptidase n=1 Tax=Cellulomonas cellasea TaxID=43670 RepID=UPI0025A41EB6|nr:M15 family metallopeptidase [Cellulomonas cellasea]MDM8085536.1 M15 family metallopeptidase [Cellulomonas cellasea]
MTLYSHGRQVRPRHRRGRRALVLVLVLAAALLSGAALAIAQGRGPGAAAGSAPPAQDSPAPVQARGDAPPADPGLDGVDLELARRVAQAKAAAADEGVALTITSGKRSEDEQQALVDAAVHRHGSVEEAKRWVLPPESSAHVRGLAVDVGPTDGALWLGEHGLDFGLCRTYANEMWHFEMLPDGANSCAPMHEDSSSGW